MVKLTRIYTKGGDKGKTSLGRGERVAKHDARVEAYGTVDEAQAVLGVAAGGNEALRLDSVKLPSATLLETYAASGWIDGLIPVSELAWERVASAADVLTVGQAIQYTTTGVLVGRFRPNDADDELDIRVRFTPEGRNLDALDSLKMPSVVKTTGSKGLHVYVPIVRGPEQKQVWTFAKALAQELAARHPALITAEYRIAKRPHGRVLVDYNQNAWGRTLASIYSVRPKPDATVSTPVTWDEVQSGVRIEDFTIRNVPARVEQRGDLLRAFQKVTARSEGRADSQSTLRVFGRVRVL